MIDAYYAEVLGKRAETRPPVEATRRAEPMKQYDRWGARGSGDVAYLRSATPREFDLSVDRHDVLVPPRRSPRQSAIERVPQPTGLRRLSPKAFGESSHTSAAPTIPSSSRTSTIGRSNAAQ